MPTIHGHVPIGTWEALQCITDTRAEYDGTDGVHSRRAMPPNLAYVLKKSTSYFNKVDSPVRPAATAKYSTETPLELMRACVEAFGRDAFFETEYLQLLDVRPKNVIELELCIEEFEVRFGDRQEELLEIVREVLGEVPVVTAEERRVEEEEMRAEAEAERELAKERGKDKDGGQKGRKWKGKGRADDNA